MTQWIMAHEPLSTYDIIHDDGIMETSVVMKYVVIVTPFVGSSMFHHYGMPELYDVWNRNNDTTLNDNRDRFNTCLAISAVS